MSYEYGRSIYLGVLGKPVLQETLELSLCEPVGSLADVLLYFGRTLKDTTSIESFELLRIRCRVILDQVLLL